MIRFTGDTHGEQGRFFELGTMGEETWTEKDTLIVCGDFGYIFKNDSIENVFLNELEKKKYTICFCCGNHENFDALFQYKQEIWNGGKVHRIRKNIYHLMRGQVFTIEGKKIFTFGGAYSIDRYMISEHYSLWRQEIPFKEEYTETVRNLRLHHDEVDYIVTHTAPREIIRRMGRQPDCHDAELTGFLEWIMYEMKYKEWFFGHWHQDMWIDEKHRALWFDIEERPSNECD